MQGDPRLVLSAAWNRLQAPISLLWMSNQKMAERAAISLETMKKRCQLIIIITIITSVIEIFIFLTYNNGVMVLRLKSRNKHSNAGRLNSPPAPTAVTAADAACWALIALHKTNFSINTMTHINYIIIAVIFKVRANCIFCKYYPLCLLHCIPITCVMSLFWSRKKLKG